MAEIRKPGVGPKETYEPVKRVGGFPRPEPLKIINKPTEPPRRVADRPGGKS